VEKAREPGEAFFRPLPLLAVVLLGVNNAWLKPLFHNALTGKLSDVAGCFFLPLFVSALLDLVSPLPLRPRLAIGSAATAALFVSIKVSQAAADQVTRVLQVIASPLGIHRLHVLADPTDLLAVPFIALACWYASTSEKTT
jgi:hypothetical protein